MLLRPRGLAGDRVAQRLVEIVLRLKAQPAGVAPLPGGGPQVAHCRLALAAVELGHLTELQRIALAGAAGKIIENAAVHRVHRPLAASLNQFEVVDRAV